MPIQSLVLFWDVGMLAILTLIYHAPTLNHPPLDTSRSQNQIVSSLGLWIPMAELTPSGLSGDFFAASKRAL